LVAKQVQELQRGLQSNQVSTTLIEGIWGGIDGPLLFLNVDRVGGLEEESFGDFAFEQFARETTLCWRKVQELKRYAEVVFGSF
jgi:hypothetical protein